MIFMSKP